MYVLPSTGIREVLYNSQVSIYVCMIVQVYVCMYVCIYIIEVCTYMRIAGHLSSNISNSKMAKRQI